ncbi:MAG: SufE family protein [Croceibacterium sp.]
MRALADILDEYEFLDQDGRHQLLIELARNMEPMPFALKTEATKVKGCIANVWAYPILQGGKLHFLADSDSSFTKGMIAVVLSAVQDRTPQEIIRTDITAALEPFNFKSNMSSNRSSNLPNMIALIKETAARLAAS